jgi:hypothetical protein
MSGSSRRPRRRLPQSGLTLCGRRWLAGAEDMCLPACWSTSFDAVLLILASVSWRLMYTSEFPSSCSAHQRVELEAWVGLFACIYACLLGLDVATMASAVATNMFRPNRAIRYLIYLRLGAMVACTAVTVVANATYFGALRTACSHEEDSPLDRGSIVSLHRLLIVLFIASLCSFLVFGSWFLCSYGFGPLCGKGTQSSWSKHIRRWLLCYSPAPSADGRNVLEEISEIFTRFFEADRAAAIADAQAARTGVSDGAPAVAAVAAAAAAAAASTHVVPSDILVGLALVEASQQRRQAAGHSFLVAAPRNRWEPDAFKPASPSPISPPLGPVIDHNNNNLSPRAQQRARQAQLEQFQVSYGATAVGGSSLMMMQGGGPTTTTTTTTLQRDLSSISSTSPDPLASSAAALASLPPAQQPETNLSTAAGLGLQPALDARDWQRIADAQHFSKYAEASYGWPMYTLVHPSCLLRCSVCQRGCKSSKFNHEHMIGSGCGCAWLGGRGTRCCHWSLASFLLTTGVAESDLLYAHLDSSPIYWLTVDHQQQCLVICCRGTLSVADVVIDMEATLSPLDSYGYPGGYTHTGILENALRLRNDLDERGHMATFLQQRPHYRIAIVGHSLGAATAALLTLLLRERFDTGPPPPLPASSSSSGMGRITPATRNRLTCIAYGCPLLVSLSVAHSEFALRCITSVAVGSDVICRLSLATLALLKDQMIAAFAVSDHNKFRILANSVRKRYAASFEPGADLSDVASPGGGITSPSGAPIAEPIGHAAADEENGMLGGGSAPFSLAGSSHGTGTATTATSHPPRVGGDRNGGDGDVAESALFLGSVAKALSALDVLPEDEQQDEYADEQKSPLQQRRSPPSQQQQNRADQLPPLAPFPLSSSAALASSSNNSGAPRASSSPLCPSPHHHEPLSLPPQIPSMIVTAPVPAAAVAAAAAAPSRGAVATTDGAAASATSASERAGRKNKAASFTMHLRRCYLPGRIYHVLPGAKLPSEPVCGGLWRRHPKASPVVYPAAQATFQEIAVGRTMFADHMPQLYSLHDLKVPQRFFEPTDEQEQAPPSPPPIVPMGEQPLPPHAQARTAQPQQPRAAVEGGADVLDAMPV